MSGLFLKVSRTGFIFALTILCAVVMFGGLQSYAAKSDLMTIAADKQKKDPGILLTMGMAEIVDVDGPIADIMVANPSIVDVMVLQSNRLYLVGVNLGTTNLIALDESGDVIKRLNVHVQIDEESMQDTLDEMFHDENIKVRALTDQLVLTGIASTPEVAQMAQNLVGQYYGELIDEEVNPEDHIVNLIKIRGKAQVMMRVKVMEVSRTLLREVGADTDIQDIGASFGGNIRNNPDPTLDGLFGGVLQTGVTETPFAVFGLLENFGAFGPVDTVLTLLEEEGLAKILAEPNLTAISGQQANFLAGGEFPVPSGRDSEGNIVIEFREFGVSLAFAPTVLSEERISLQLETEVSSLSRDTQVTLEDIEVPGLDVRRASTTVEMGSGASLMIAGLLQSQTINSLSGIPGMVNTPIIGDLMSSEGFRREETEMVVLVTPYLVEPFSDKTQARKIAMPKKDANFLAHAFADNVRRMYGDLKVSGLLNEGDADYGYILD